MEEQFVLLLQNTSPAVFSPVVQHSVRSTDVNLKVGESQRAKPTDVEGWFVRKGVVK